MDSESINLWYEPFPLGSTLDIAHLVVNNLMEWKLGRFVIKLMHSETYFRKIVAMDPRLHFHEIPSLAS